MIDVNFTYAQTDGREEFEPVIDDYSSEIEKIFFNIQSDDACYLTAGNEALMSLQPLHDYKIGVINHFVFINQFQYVFEFIESAIEYLKRIDVEIDEIIIPSKLRDLIVADDRFSKFHIGPAGAELAAALRRLGAGDGWRLRWSI